MVAIKRGNSTINAKLQKSSSTGSVKNSPHQPYNLRHNNAPEPKVRSTSAKRSWFKLIVLQVSRLPSVVTPTFSPTLPSHKSRSYKYKQHKPTGLTIASTAAGSQKLSAVKELSPISSPSSSQKNSKFMNEPVTPISADTPSTGSTLKGSLEVPSDQFDPDSLEATLQESPPPVVAQQPLSPKSPHSPNDVTNYAVNNGSTPLSMIWNRLQEPSTDRESSSGKAILQ